MKYIKRFDNFKALENFNFNDVEEDEEVAEEQELTVITNSPFHTIEVDNFEISLYMHSFNDFISKFAELKEYLKTLNPRDEVECGIRRNWNLDTSVSIGFEWKFSDGSTILGPDFGWADDAEECIEEIDKFMNKLNNRNSNKNNYSNYYNSYNNYNSNVVYLTVD